jgi:dolichol-phosphate mannosyltransferase
MPQNNDFKTKPTLSIVIPAHNEEGGIERTVCGLIDELRKQEVPFDILVVNDNSSDKTEEILQELKTKFDEVDYVNNIPPNGFGFAVRKGLESFKGDAVAVVMADASDSPADVCKYYYKLSEGYDCVFGSRFIRGGKIIDYPKHKLFLNRLFNFFIKILFGLRYNDVTNAFKMYRRTVIIGLQPILSHHFNLTVELPLKAIVRGYSYAVVPNSWTNRQEGISKLKIKEMGSRYLFIVLYCFVEKWLSRGDYRKENILES